MNMVKVASQPKWGQSQMPDVRCALAKVELKETS